MLKRLIFGLVKGFLIGAVLAAVVVKGLAMATWTTLFAFLFAAAAGVLTALLTGKPRGGGGLGGGGARGGGEDADGSDS